MKTREEIITSMCYSARHDYGLDKIGDTVLSYGLTQSERIELWNSMAKIFDETIAPYIKEYREQL